jgi:hypothetical protein
VRLSVHFAAAADADALLASRDDVTEVARVADKEELLFAIGVALGFPGYFGANWDAFDECLRDVACATLIVRDAAALWTAMPAEMITLVDIWCVVAEDSEGPLDLIFVL